MADDTLLQQRLRDASTPSAFPTADLAPVLRRARFLRLRRWTAGAVACAVVVTALVVPVAALRHLHHDSDLQGATHLSALGLSIEVPDGWHARIVAKPGFGGASLQASTRALPPPDAMFGYAANMPGAQVGVVEVSGLCPCGAFSPVEAIRGFDAADWYRPDPVGSDRTTRVFQNQGGYLSLVTIGARSFVVWAKFPQRPAPGDLLDQVDRLLSSITVNPGPVPFGTWHPPVSIAPGASGVEGTAWSDVPSQSPTAMAWSVPLATEDVVSTALQGAFWFYPLQSVDRMPRDGVIVVATSMPRGAAHASAPISLQLDDASVEQHWEGAELRRITRFSLQGTFGTRTAQVAVYFGTPHPSTALRARAQSVLDRVMFYPNG